jgi:polar amino acid transport system substrate-binding protein
MRHLLAGALALALAAPSAALDLAQIKSQGVLRVIAAADEAPETFSFAGGARPGFERELVEGFAKLQGLKLEAVKVKLHSDRIPALTRGDGDVIVAIFDTEDRRKLVDFTVEVMPTHNVSVTLAPRPAVQSLAELKTLRVGAIRGAKPAEEATAAGVSALSLFDTQEEMKQALKRGAIDAMVLPISELVVVSRDSAGLVAGVTVGPPGRVAWAVRKQDAALRAALDEYLGNVRRGPSWSRLLVQYFGDQALQVLGRGR